MARNSAPSNIDAARTRERIAGSLSRMTGVPFEQAAEDLLDTLGYRSDRTLQDQSGRPSDFAAEFPADNPGTKSEQDFLEHAASARLVFQLSDSEIRASASQQGVLLETGDFDRGHSRSFFFVAVELKGSGYSRTRYVSFTREINKRFLAPTIVLFRTGDGLLSLAFAHRRQHKRDSGRDVLGKVSLVREIDPTKAHRAHLDILAELSLADRVGWMDDHAKQRDFGGLLAAWLATLDTQELNKRFYRELFTWFERAVKKAKFPTGEAKVLDAEEHVIRLITRLLFTWFMKEKGLVSGNLFVEKRVRRLLTGYDRESGDSYYRAVLQNLFFATLNTEIGKRRFSAGSNTTYREFSRYRFKKEMSDPNSLLALFERTPFINGGLFDCLDTEESKTYGGYRIDCFSDVDYKLVSIPNRLFFDPGGLIALFDRYKFTVEENTPAEQEVALDPELLGSVFENLLAAYNPETRETARKQTGSYYTPRPVVDYMVDEALVEALAEKVRPTPRPVRRSRDDGTPSPAIPDDQDKKFWRERLRYLLDYEDAFDDANELFDSDETGGLVQAISGIRVLDPAVGSGAFPMGVLHKLTLALRRLDPDNQSWEGLQKELAGDRAAAAFGTRDQRERDAELAEISDTFERYRDSDFGRKLYLVQNSIFGVDIQPVACQIAKLRFFISLAIEQEPDPGQDNFGVKPLPNLETRFVAANTLLGLGEPIQIPLGGQNRLTELNDRLRENRERHFHAGARREKLKIRDDDKRLRGLLEEELVKVGMDKSDARKVSDWDPYDQNASAGWFDPEYMFGVTEGFDVVIGNPPYRQVRKGEHSPIQFPYSEGKDKGKQNLYKLFVEQSYNLTKNGGLATLIVQSSLMCDFSSAATRQLLLERTRLRHVIEFPKAAPTREAQLFQNVTQGTCIYQFTKALSDGKSISISVGNDAHTIADLRFATITNRTIMTLYPDLLCFPHIKEGSVAILERIARDETIKPLRYYTTGIVQGDLNLTTHSRRFSPIRTAVRLLRGRNIGRFVIKYDTSSEYCDDGFMTDKVERNRQGVFLISQEVTGTNDVRRLHFGLAEDPPTDYLCGHSTNKTQLKNPSHSKAFLGLLNAKFMDWFFRVTSTNNHVQGYELDQLPIPAMNSADRKRIGSLVERVVEAKSANHNADTRQQEAEIDRLVYDLYGMTPDEIAVVEGPV